MSRKIVAVLIAIVAILIMGLACGCESQPTDAGFARDLEAGLEESWDSASKTDASIPYFIYVEPELNRLSKYKDYTFEDAELGELAHEYISILEEEQKIVAEDPDFSSKKANDSMRKLQYQRAVILSKLMNGSWGFGFAGDAYNRRNLNDTIAQNWAYYIIQNTNWKKSRGEFGELIYTATIKNDSGLDFPSFYIEVQFLDSEEAVVDSSFATAINWRRGQKYKFEVQTWSKDASSYTLGSFNLFWEDN